jgi:F-type H+-transporting ATPase subunit gamma
MTQTYAQLHARKRSVSQLGDVISAMRGVAAARSQQSRRQLANVQTYADTVADAISQVLSLVPSIPRYSNGHGGAALLLFCAEHGFAGAFSEQILDRATPLLEGKILLMVGSRGVRLARARHLNLHWSAPMMSQLSNAGALADRVASELYRLLHTGRISRVDVMHAKPESSQGFEVVLQPLLPLDFERFSKAGTGVPPLLNLAPQVLLERLAGEYLFAQLNEAIVHSYAAENLARLQTMTAARENIAHRLETLNGDERLARQSEITAEIIELAAGAQALG